jgi:hypothetical protein
MKKSGPFDPDVSVVCGVCQADGAGRGAPPETSVEITSSRRELSDREGPALSE